MDHDKRRRLFLKTYKQGVNAGMTGTPQRNKSSMQEAGSSLCSRARVKSLDLAHYSLNSFKESTEIPSYVCFPFMVLVNPASNTLQRYCGYQKQQLEPQECILSWLVFFALPKNNSLIRQRPAVWCGRPRQGPEETRYHLHVAVTPSHARAHIISDKIIDFSNDEGHSSAHRVLNNLTTERNNTHPPNHRCPPDHSPRRPFSCSSLCNK